MKPAFDDLLSADVASMLDEALAYGMAKDGGPAFPQPHWPNDEWDGDQDGDAKGMSLRDWFAGQAFRFKWGSGDPMTVEDTAKMAYEVADAMLAARQARP